MGGAKQAFDSGLWPRKEPLGMEMAVRLKGFSPEGCAPGNLAWCPCAPLLGVKLWSLVLRPKTAPGHLDAAPGPCSSMHFFCSTEGGRFVGCRLRV